MRDIMKLNSKRAAAAEWLVITAVLIVKTVLTQPFYEQIFWLSGTYYISKSVVLAAVEAVVFAVVFSLMLKDAAKLGEWAKVPVVLLVAEPLFVSSSVSVFNVLAVLITVIWVAVCIRFENRIIAAAVSVVSAAAISFVMPCSVFSLVVLGILVLVITAKSDTLSVTATLIGTAASVAAAVICVQLSDAELRNYFKINEVFGEYGGTECHPLTFDSWKGDFGLAYLFESFGRVAFASLPIVAFAAFVVYAVIRYNGGDEKKSSKKADAFKKGITVALVIVPYVFLAIGATLCTGVGALAAFNFAPLAVILALASAGNRYVIDALGRVSSFAKEHPVVSVVAIVWVASYTMAFSGNGKIFTYATQFFM